MAEKNTDKSSGESDQSQISASDDGKTRGSDKKADIANNEIPKKGQRNAMSPKRPQWFNEHSVKNEPDTTTSGRSTKKSLGLIVGFIILIIVLIGIVAVLVNAQFDTQSSPEKSAKALVESIATKDGEQWCAVMEPKVRQQIEENLKQGSVDDLKLAGLREPTCPEYFRVMMDLFSDSINIDQSAVTYKVISQDDKSAVVEVDMGSASGEQLMGAKDGQKLKLHLIKQGDKWYVQLKDALVPTS